VRIQDEVGDERNQRFMRRRLRLEERQVIVESRVGTSDGDGLGGSPAGRNEPPTIRANGTTKATATSAAGTARRAADRRVSALGIREAYRTIGDV
jgi:hypothetical protein